MPDKPSNLVPGHARYAHPKTFARSLCMDNGFSVRIEQMSKGVFRLNYAGSYFSPFNDEKGNGLIDGEWKPSEKHRRARYYTLTAKGRKRARKPNTRMGQGNWRQVGRIFGGRVGSEPCPLLRKITSGLPVTVPKGSVGPSLNEEAGRLLGDGSGQKR